MSNNKQSLIKNSIIMVIFNISAKAMSFLLLPLYTSYLTPDDFGIIDITNTFINLLTVVLTLCMGSSFFVFYNEKDSENYKLKVFNSTFFLLVFVSLIPIVLILFSSNISAILFGTTKYTLLVKIALIVIPANLLNLIPSCLLRINNRLKLFANINLIVTFIILILNILFVVKLDLAFYSLILSTLVGAIINFLIYLVLINRTISIKKVDFGILKEILIYALPLVPATISSWIIDLSDRYIINNHFTTNDVGIYALANKIVLIVLVLSQSFQTAFPGFAFGDKNDNSNKYRSVLNYFTIFMTGVALFISIFAKEFVTMLSTKDYYEAYKMIVYLAFGQVAYGMAYIVGIGMSISKKSKYSMKVSWMSAIINIGLNLLFINKFGVVFAAITTLISFIFIFVFNYYYSQKFYPLKYDFIKCIITFSCALVISIIVIRFNIIVRILSFFVIIAILYFINKEEVNLLLNSLKAKYLKGAK